MQLIADKGFEGINFSQRATFQLFFHKESLKIIKDKRSRDKFRLYTFEEQELTFQIERLHLIIRVEEKKAKICKIGLIQHI